MGRPHPPRFCKQESSQAQLLRAVSSKGGFELSSCQKSTNGDKPICPAVSGQPLDRRQ